MQKFGDLVSEGSILIGGWMEGNYTGIRYSHARGEVIAKVWYSKSAQMELKQDSVRKTGNIQKHYSIKFNNFKINLNKTLPKFQKYDTIDTDKKIKLFSDFYLPITLGISTYYELEEEEKTYSKEEAVQILTDKLKSELSEEIQDLNNVQDIKINKNENDTSVDVEVIYEVLESIGTEEKIL